MTFLVDGSIPAHMPCPWKHVCPLYNKDPTLSWCHHKGTEHDVPFSCASARGFELIGEPPSLGNCAAAPERPGPLT